MAIALVSHVKKAGGVGLPNSVTTAAIVTTGADFLVAVVSFYTPTSARVMSDSKGNIWISLTAFGVAGRFTCIYYCANAVVGAGHTFTFATNNSYSALFVAAYSGVHAVPFDGENGAGDGVPDISTPTGCVTPNQNDSLIVAGVCSSGSAFLIGGGFAVLDSIDYSSDNMGGGLAFLIQPGAAIVNPTWSWTTSSYFSAAIAIFKPAAALTPKKFMLQSAISGRVLYVEAVSPEALQATLDDLGFALPRNARADSRVIFPEELPRVTEYVP